MRTTTYNQMCRNCGAIYEIMRIKVPYRDKGIINCHECSQQLCSWNESWEYSSKLVSPASETTLLETIAQEKIEKEKLEKILEERLKNSEPIIIEEKKQTIKYTQTTINELLK